MVVQDGLSLREAVSKQAFVSNDETVLFAIQAAHANKRKKVSVLCIVTTSKGDGYLWQVKHDGSTYKRKRSWLLENIQSFDGKNQRDDNLELDFTSDKPYHWLFSDSAERTGFIQATYKACRQYCKKSSPKFTNIPEKTLVTPVPMPDLDETSSEQDADEDMRLLNFQLTELSEREEDDLLRLLEDCEASGQSGLLEAESFYQRLQDEASRLDDASLESMVICKEGGKSESEIVVDHLDSAEADVSNVLNQLDDYASIVSTVYNKVILIEEKQRMIQTKNQNSRKLMVLLQRFVGQLDVDLKDLQVLADADFSQSESAIKLCASAENLKTALRPSLPPGMEKLAAFQEQRKKHERVKNKFSQKLQMHLRNMFTHLTSMSSDGGVVRPVQELTLAGHSAIHRLLRPYTQLSLWLKDADPPAHEDLIKAYAQAVSRLYERDIKQFFQDARKAIGAKGRGSSIDHSGGGGGGVGMVSESVRGLIRGAKHVSMSAVGSPGAASGPGSVISSMSSSSKAPYESQLLGLDADQFMVGSADDVARREVFDQMLDCLLSELQPVCLAEQNFCMKFFRLGGPASGSSISSSISQGSLVSTATLGLVGPITGSRKGSLHALEAGDSPSGGMNPNAAHESKVMTAELRKLMAAIFPNLSSELTSFIQHYSDKVDGFNSMVLLVGLSEHVLKAQDTGSFLSVTFGSALIQAKRSLDKFMQAQLKSLDDFKPRNFKKLGILPFIRNFESLVRTSEGIYGDCPRRADLDKWYVFLVEKIFETVERLASSDKMQNAKNYTGDVARMENYWYLWSVLSQVKVIALEGERKKAKELYNDALQRYVVEHFGQPLEKLNTFFEGVLALVAGGVREEEVCYRVAYSKSELRKVIALYPPKEVQKGLEHLYVVLQKTLSVEANLLQVVWRGMQEEFLNQYKTIEDLIHRCYPDSRIQLEFTVQDILRFFSDIAMKHS